MNRLELDLHHYHKGWCGERRQPTTSRGLTNEDKRATLVSTLTQFVARASWRATAKSFIVSARDEDEALEKALQSKEAKGCMTVTITKRCL